MAEFRIKAEFKVVRVGKPSLTLSIERKPRFHEGHGDESHHTALIDGHMHGEYDTGYDWIPTEPALWSEYWACWAECEFKAKQVLRTYLLWEAKEAEGGK